VSFTAKDVALTYKTIAKLGVAIRSRSGFELIADVIPQKVMVVISIIAISWHIALADFVTV
jgi:hypothetical protein